LTKELIAQISRINDGTTQNIQFEQVKIFTLASLIKIKKNKKVRIIASLMKIKKQYPNKTSSYSLAIKIKFEYKD